MKNIIVKCINKYFNYAKIATLQQVQKKLNINIKITVKRYLTKLEYFTSYSHNGKYYSHRRIANFDTNGLWSYKGIYFSIHEKLIDTIENFIITSEFGFNSNELGEILHIDVKNALLKLVRNKRIIRKKINCRFYYFSNVPAVQKAQLLLCRSIVEQKFGIEKDDEKILDDRIKRGFALFFNQLDEKQKRLYSGLESALLGYGGDKIIASTFGLDPHTVSRGRQEILSGNFEKACIRKQGAGRKPIKKKSKT